MYRYTHKYTSYLLKRYPSVESIITISYTCKYNGLTCNKIKC